MLRAYKNSTADSGDNKNLLLRRLRFTRDLAIGMLQAQISEYSDLAGAGANSDRDSDSWHNLQTVRKVVRPANSGVEQKLIAPLCLSRSCNGFAAIESCFQKCIETRSGGPHN